MLNVLTSKVAVAVFGRASAQIYALVIMLLAGRVLAPERFGEFAAAWLVIVILYTLVYIGIYEYILRTRAFERVVDTCFWMIFAVGALGTAIALACAYISQGFEDYARLPSLFLMMSPLPIVMAPQAWLDALLIRDDRIRTQNLSLFASETIAAASTIIALMNGWGVYALALWRMVGLAVTLTLFFAFVRRLPRFRFRPRAAAVIARRVLPLFGGRLTEMTSNYSADFMIAFFLTPAAVGLYRISSRITSAVSDLFYQPLKQIVWARMSQAERAAEPIKPVWLQHLTLLTILSWPALTVIAAYNAWFVELALGDEWLAGGAIISILAFARAAVAFDMFFEAGMVCSGRARTQFYTRVAYMITLLVLLLIFARHGPDKAAIAVLIAAVFYASVGATLLARTLKASLWDVARALAPAVLVSAACWAFAHLGVTAAKALDAVLIGEFAGLALAAGAAWLLAVAVMWKRGLIIAPRL